MNGTTFNIQKWSQGKLLPFVLITFPDDFNIEQIDIPDSEARKGLIPLITSASSVCLQTLHNSKYWRQLAAKS